MNHGFSCRGCSLLKRIHALSAKAFGNEVRASFITRRDKGWPMCICPLRLRWPKRLLRSHELNISPGFSPNRSASSGVGGRLVL